MQEKIFLIEYFKKYQTLIFEDAIMEKIISMRDTLIEMKERGNKVIFIGNGGSAAISSHCAVDYTKQAGIRAVTFNESSLITCFANDYGYELWVGKAIEYYADTGDVIVSISSSGKSPNIINAVRYAKEAKHIVITFTGFDQNNLLNIYGDINFWVNSKAYNIIECTHQIWLLAVCDLIIGKAEYPAS